MSGRRLAVNDTVVKNLACSAHLRVHDLATAPDIRRFGLQRVVRWDGDGPRGARNRRSTGTTDDESAGDEPELRSEKQGSRLFEVQGSGKSVASSNWGRYASASSMRARSIISEASRRASSIAVPVSPGASSSRK